MASVRRVRRTGPKAAPADASPSVPGPAPPAVRVGGSTPPPIHLFRNQGIDPLAYLPTSYLYYGRRGRHSRLRRLRSRHLLLRHVRGGRVVLDSPPLRRHAQRGAACCRARRAVARTRWRGGTSGSRLAAASTGTRRRCAAAVPSCNPPCCPPPPGFAPSCCTRPLPAHSAIRRLASLALPASRGRVRVCAWRVLRAVRPSAAARAGHGARRAHVYSPRSSRGRGAQLRLLRAMQRLRHQLHDRRGIFASALGSSRDDIHPVTAV